MFERVRRGKGIKRRMLCILSVFGFLTGVTAAIFFGGGISAAAQEKALSGRSWERVEQVLQQKLGEGYEEVGMCTGFLYWCLDHAYGVDWGSNSRVKELEDKLEAAGVSRVEKGRSGVVTEDMHPGDIVIFAEGAARTHCAILGEDGRLYHADCSGVREGPTLREWMELPEEARNCRGYIIYRGLRTEEKNP